MLRFGAKRCFFQNSGFSLAKISEILKWPNNAIFQKGKAMVDFVGAMAPLKAFLP